MKILMTCLVVCVMGLASMSMAQDIVITQNPDCATDEGTMVACGGEGGSTAENWFARNFYIDQNVTINSITWGSANVNSTLATIYFSIASGPGNPDGVTLTPVGQATAAINAGPFYDTPVDTPFEVPAGSYLVVEFHFPDTGTEPGAMPTKTNTATETTYIRAADCGLTSYASVDAIGFPDSQMIMCLNATFCMEGYDCNTNGIDDCDDIVDGTSEDCNANGIPDECDVADGTSFDCDQNNVPDECQPDCDGDGWIDPCDNDGDVDGDGIPDNCEPDCNGNTIPDDFEIKLGIAQDCNGNNIPDSCDIADGTEEDCNGNNIPDSCDIADGTEEDCNENGIPDSCESDDCNENGQIDFCEIEEDPSLDCDEDGLLDSCAIEIGEVEDCNENGIPDNCDLEDPNNDQNNNGELDNCECVGDADLDGYVNVNDLLIIIGYWGNNIPQADLNFDGIVDVSDLLIVIGNWGECE